MTLARLAFVLSATLLLTACKTKGDTASESVYTPDSADTCLSVGDVCDDFSMALTCCEPFTCDEYNQCS